MGVVAPLVIGTASGSASFGLLSTIGALQTAFADRPGPYRLRILRMLGTALAAAITSGLAIAASRSDAASVLLLLVLSFAAGLLLAGGPSAMQVGTAGVAAALILGHLSTPASAAPHVSLLVLLGGVGQTLLAIAGWPLRRHQPERMALATLYRELAGAARAQQGSVVGPPAGVTLTSVRQTLYGLGHDHGPSVEAYRVLLDEAERIRREIVVLVAVAERLADDGVPILAGLVRGSLTSAASVLDEAGDALAEARPIREPVLDAARADLRQTIERLESDDHTGYELTRRAGVARLRALGGQLRAVVESSRTGASEGRRDEDTGRLGVQLLRDPIAILRANFSLESAVLRHAIRLSVFVTASDLVLRLSHVDRGYWVSLTLLVVLRPDFATTLQRSVMRVVGTVVGLLLATGLVHWIPGGSWWQIALIALFAFGMRFAGPGNIALSAVCLSGLVVVLLEINGVPAHTTVVSRALATLAGGGLAVLAALVWPAWERRFVAPRLAELLGAYSDYVRVVVDPFADRGTVQRARAACRLARTNAQASVDRAGSEPVRGQGEVELGRAVLAHTHRFIHAMLSVDAVRPAIRRTGGIAALTEFLTSAAEVLDTTRDALSRGEPPAAVVSLRGRQEELATRLGADPDAAGGLETVSTLIEASDRMTNSLDTLVEELHRQLPLPSSR